MKDKMELKSKKKQRSKDFRNNDDITKVLSDSRFAHVPFDPKLRNLPKKERKFKLDSRFSSMFTDEKFHEKTIMDPRGRPANYATKEKLDKFYDLSEGESDEEEDKESEEEEEDEESKEDNEEVEPITKKSKLKKKKKYDSSEDETDEESDDPEVSKTDAERVQDMTQDFARGAVLFSDDSSDDDSSSDEDLGGEFEWGELDKDAVWDNETEVEETSRFAVCNLDWDHIKAVDVMVVVNSFCPTGGSVKKVTIYPSEFGKQRMQDEDKYGPTELLSNDKSSSVNEEEEPDLDLLAKGKIDFKSDVSKYEDLRRYERNRLLYYYAVVECDSVDTSKTIYSECNGHPFESAGIHMDLRYIPNDMTFDETPHDMCESVPEFYENKIFITSAMLSSRPTLSWDQTDPSRVKGITNAMRCALGGEEFNEDYLMNFIASSSESESDLAEESDYSSDENEEGKRGRIQKFRRLMQEIDEKEKKKKEGRLDMETVFGTEGNKESGSDSSSEEDEKPNKDINPFEKYLQKRRDKKKEKKDKKMKAQKGDEEEDDDEADDRSLDDLRDDPFFAEEIKKREKEESNSKKKKKKKRNVPETEEKEEKQEQEDLALLLMDEDAEERKHFSMKEIIDKHKGKSKKKLKKLKKKGKVNETGKENAEEDFKVDVADPRFSNLISSGDYNIDPSHPQFKRTKAVDDLIGNIQKKRRAESFENMSEPKKANTSKGKEELELSMLVKRVKNKSKKPK